MLRPECGLRLVAALLCVGSLVSGCDRETASAKTRAAPASFEVAPRVESDPIPKRSGELDDAAIWVHPTDPARSRVLGTVTKAGLAVYDLDGRQLELLEGGHLNNVDLRYGFTLGGESIALALASNFETRSGHVAAFTIGAEGEISPYDLELIEPDPPLRKGIYGLCMYRSPYSGEFHVFFNSEAGEVQQWRLRGVGNAIASERVRHFQAPGRTEGCVADDERGVLYLGVEKGGIYQYDAEPDGGAVGELIAPVKPRGYIKPDLEGLALYYTVDGGGYLLASSQGSSEFIAYERGGQHAYVARFRIAAAQGIDAVSKTDGIDVVGFPLGRGFPNGVFIAQDDKNPGGGQNFKLVPWQQIAEATDPPLAIETNWDPRR
jgi:3-phytase